MNYQNTRLVQRLKDGLAQAVFSPAGLAFVPAVCLGAFWLGGEMALLVAALGVPILYGLFGSFRNIGPMQAPDRLTGALLRDRFELTLEEVYHQTDGSGLRSAVLVLEIDEFDALVEAHGHDAADAVVQRTCDRMVSTLRQRDSVARYDQNKFVICLQPVMQMDLELAIQLAGRIQSALEEPISVGGMSLFTTSSIGVCLRNQAPGHSSHDWYIAACDALEEAKAVAPAGLRVYSPVKAPRLNTSVDLREEVASALENGMIQAWFQPQVCTDTGKVSGFEALARWSHPAKGMIAPSSFLPALEEAGLMQRLSQHMIVQSLTALKSWDAAGLDVPCVGVNFATDELRDPGLVEHIRYELDRFGLTPDRLSVEILETVMTDNPDDMITRNITALGELGCRIDLDDFGTGHASIASVRRFRVSRIKIDRSFVTKSDHDPDQQKLIAAILTMAERLDLDTLAEGVETVGEHALLAQLGCGHVQGFGIGRPMPFDQTIDWTVAHEAKLKDAPQIGRQGS